MAKEFIIVDDLDGQRDNVRTHTFSLDAYRYEIDLSPQNLANLKAALEPYVSAGRIKAKPRDRTKEKSTESREERQRIRAWARDNGIEVAARGAFPKDVVNAYREATGGS